MKQDLEMNKVSLWLQEKQLLVFGVKIQTQAILENFYSPP